LKEEAMRILVAIIALVTVLALLSGTALAQQGTSSSWGSVGWGPVIPTQALSDKDRSWNFDHEPQYRAEAGAEWLREHSQAPAHPWFH
jgi:hypothetical protein